MANTLTFASVTLTDAEIYGGISFTHDLNTGDEFTIGNTASASVKFVTETQLPLYTKDQTNGVFTWTQDNVSRGTYYITEVTKADGKYDITAYDAMSLLDVNISALSISFPATVSGLASAIATYIGCTVSGTIVNGSLAVNSLDADMSVRQLLGYIAEASGCSVKIDGSNHLCFMYYADSGITLTPSDYVKIEVADYTCAAIDNVTIYNSEGNIQASYGSGGNSLFIGQNPFLETAMNSNAHNIYDVVHGLVYAPVRCDLFDESGLEVGTIATFGTTATLIMHIDSSESGATASSVGSDSRAAYNKSVVVLANEAKAVAIDAQAVASAAAGLLSDMQAAATAAQTTLTGIYQDAEDALTNATAAQTSAEGAAASASDAALQASTANAYANSALDQLGIVQDVVGVLNLLSTNATYQLTTDTEIVPGKWYFTRSGTSPDYVYTVVNNPDVSDIGTYYEMTDIDAAVKNYVTSRLTVTSDGLLIQDPSMQTRILLSPDEGVVLRGPDGSVIGKYGSTAQIGDEAGFHISLSGTRLGFWRGSETDPNNEIAYISGQQLYITKSVVLQRMDLGTMMADGGLGQWSWKIHANGENPPRNNLNLKWVG